jgi:hypothetical protein
MYYKKLPIYRRRVLQFLFKVSFTNDNSRIMAEETSKYCKSEYRISYDQALAESYQPIIYDPYQYGIDNNPRLYFRVVESNGEKCVQYFYYWDRQDCKKDYVISEPNTVGSILGLLFAISEYIVASILGMYFQQMLLVPIWIQFIASFFIGVVIGVKFHNSINDIKVFQRIAGLIVGGFFTHDNDFEPILVFAKNSEITKIVISGRGSLDSEPHRNDIYVKQNYHNEGESIFCLQEPMYVNGKLIPENPPPRIIFKEFEDTKLKYSHENDNDYDDKIHDDRHHQHPKFAIVTCYHAFTGEPIYYDDHVFEEEKNILNFTLAKLTDDVLEHWYHDFGFGHEVGDPFTFPYIRFAGEVKRGRTSILALLEALSMIMKGLIALKKSLTSLGTKTQRKKADKCCKEYTR